jgi:apolipoprotein D and lipocalin family protein
VRRLTGAALAMIAACGVSGAGADDLPHVRPVRQVDLERYAGRWHEIAKIPNRFQKGCARGTTAEYFLEEDGTIRVVNSCLEKDGDVKETEGAARVVDRRSNARLEVSFVSFAGWRPFWGDYWIIGLDPDYAWAVVGTPDREYGWILARTPTLDDASLEAAFASLERNGYRRDAFVMSPP